MKTYTFHINTYDLAFFGAIFIGLTFALQLWFSKRVNRAANRFLAAALAVAVFWIGRLLAIDIQLAAYLPFWSRLPLQFSLALGPLIFFYVLKITRPEYKFRTRQLLHFSPLLLEFGTQALEVSDSIKTGAATYETLAFRQLNPVLQLLAFISVSAYLYASRKLIDRFYRGLKFNGGDRYRYELRWLHRLLSGIGLLWLLWIPFTAVDYFYYHYQLSIHAYYSLYLLLAIMMIRMAAKAFLRPEAGVPAGGASFLKPPLPAEMMQRGTWLKKAVKAGLYYQDPELSLNSLAEKLELGPHELSRIINTAIKKNFHDFISEYRVADVIKKMQDPRYDHITLLGIAYDSGFNSKSTFNRIFKEMTGKSPAEYKSDLKKEFPVYKLGRSTRFATVISYHETIPNWSHEKLNRNYMFKNYFVSAVRSLRSNKLFSFINIFGLATGMACSILILLWVQDELSYDKFNVNAPQIYRLTDELSGEKAAVTALPMAPALKQQIPAVKNFTRLKHRQFVITIGTRKFDEKNIFYADPNFLQMFTYPMADGDPARALSRPDGVVITEQTARRYFGTEKAIGKIIHADDDVKPHDYMVTAVMKNIPHNSHLQFDMLLPLTAFEHSTNYSYNDPEEWGNFILYTYIQLDDKFEANKQSIAALERQITTIQRDNDPSHAKDELMLQPLTDIHLHSNFMLDVGGQGNSQSVNIFSLVSVFILLIACINFMNLSTALSGQRAKEVGIRKTVGALRGQLIIQFLGESLLLSIISLVIGLAIAWLLLPVFNDLASKNISVDPLSFRIILSLLGVAVFAGLISGSYPALYLSSFNPVKVLKGMRIFGGSKAWLRNGLVVFQFAVSVILMVSTLVVNNQLSFIRNRDIGFNKENLMYLKMPTVGDLKQNFGAIKATLSQNTGIDNYTLIEHLPTDLTTGTIDVKWDGKDPRRQIVFPHIGVDGNFIKVFGLHLVAGRAFDDNNPADGHNYILNETSVRTMGLTPSVAIGKQISMNGTKGEIVGVVRDFNFKPVQQLIQPLVLRYTRQGGFIVIKTRPANMQRSIAGLRASFKDVYHDYPFSYGFVDQDIDSLYLSEQRMGKLFNIFSVISIVVSCLGLFGLATFAIQRRIKEIGIRRVLGASSAGLVTLLAKDFVKLVIVALVVGFPVAWWAMNEWLDNYVYRTHMNWWMFALAGIAAMLISMLTISYQSVKAARANPVKSLRSE